jgi:monoamine oxidase
VVYSKSVRRTSTISVLLLVLGGCGSGGSAPEPVVMATGDSIGSSDSSDTAHDVIVVGAGSAGLYATKTLQSYGYDVLIIEATDRIGGRIKSASLGDMRVELGAEEHYLDEGNNPVWPAIRAEYGDGVYVQAYQGLSAYSMDNGTNTCWTKNLAFKPCSNDDDVTVMGDFWGWYWIPEEHQDPYSSLADDVLDTYGVDLDHRGYHLYDAGIAGASFATNLNKLGARSLALQSSEWTLSDSVRVISNKDLGYLDALETVWWDKVVANSDILLNSPVVTIDTSGDDVLVIDSQGNRHAARQVIVTVSIGVLKAEIINFTPDLPYSTVAAYNGIGIDKGMKVPIRFRSAWWETEGERLAWLVTEGVAGACWAPSNYKIDTSSYILMCYPMGKNSEELSQISAEAGGDAAGDDAIIEAILADLDNTFPQAQNQASSNFIEGLVQDWGSAPYTLGAYSYPKIETFVSNQDNKRRELKTPVAENRILFAGEATHETHPATVVGALHEGERAANKVHSVNGVPNNPPSLPL